jgi:hypothetical protein
VSVGVGVPTGFERAQRRRAGKLGVDQDHQMIPAAKRLVVSVSAPARHDRLETPPIEEFDQLAENGKIFKPRTQCTRVLDFGFSLQLEALDVVDHVPPGHMFAQNVFRIRGLCRSSSRITPCRPANNSPCGSPSGANRLASTVRAI